VGRSRSPCRRGATELRGFLQPQGRGTGTNLPSSASDDGDRQNIAGSSPFDPIVGTRAVRVGNQISVARRTATDANSKIVPVDAYAQATPVLRNIGGTERAGATLTDVVRRRMFVTDISRQRQRVGRAHGECFATIRPVTTMVEVKALIDSAMLVEIEAMRSSDRTNARRPTFIVTIAGSGFVGFASRWLRLRKGTEGR
jgi:enamine deaminase RidA (YjgF/YER057c/UK114 family)